MPALRMQNEYALAPELLESDGKEQAHKRMINEDMDPKIVC